jgi:hypothetical protein
MMMLDVLRAAKRCAMALRADVVLMLMSEGGHWCWMMIDDAMQGADTGHRLAIVHSEEKPAKNELLRSKSVATAV